MDGVGFRTASSMLAEGCMHVSTELQANNYTAPT